MASHRPDPNRQIAKAKFEARYKEVLRMPLPAHNRKLCETLIALLQADELEVAAAIDIVATARQEGHTKELLVVLTDFANEFGLIGPDEDSAAPSEN